MESYVARWASQHSRLAILLIVLCELTNACIGITAGSALLAGLLPLQLLVLIGSAFVIRTLILKFHKTEFQHLRSSTRFLFQKRIFVSLFCLNLWIYTLGGAVLGSMVQSPQPTSSLHSSMTVVTSEQYPDFSKKTSPKEEEKKPKSSNEGLIRLGYILLFVAGVALSYIGALLACNLACAGIGWAAVAVLLLGLGIMAGGFYFLGRAIDKNMKPFKEMTPDERKREKRRYWRTALGTVLVTAFLILLSALS
ncbi:hypothetical protein [Runella sp. SP2]|uniref:hypothetical protein n=1 Tax=Runella sp. SP2 TaxID=2268026 RepID=UPI000F088294|nr:hypothetical protein [Runella sp. SP2]AYQ32830.1 hypothetical protein DTQ70_12025 [Runella sp. SP2]